MIFKLQRPLLTSESKETCLIYNKDRSIVFALPLLPELRALFGDRFKIYIDSNIKRPNRETMKESLLIGKIVDDQAW